MIVSNLRKDPAKEMIAEKCLERKTSLTGEPSFTIIGVNDGSP